MSVVLYGQFYKRWKKKNMLEIELTHTDTHIDTNPHTKRAPNLSKITEIFSFEALLTTSCSKLLNDNLNFIFVEYDDVQTPHVIIRLTALLRFHCQFIPHLIYEKEEKNIKESKRLFFFSSSGSLQSSIHFRCLPHIPFLFFASICRERKKFRYFFRLVFITVITSSNPWTKILYIHKTLNVNTIAFEYS